MKNASKPNLHNNMLEKLTNILHLTSAYLFYPLIILLIACDVTLRWLFNHPLAWSLETSCLLLIPAVLLAAGKTEQEEAHVKLDVIYPKLNRTGKFFVDIIGSGIALFWSIAMLIRGTEEAFVSYDFKEGGAITPIPYWPFRVLFVLAFFVLSCVILNKIFMSFKKMKTGAEND